jgi:hypothetical protein
MFYNKFIVFICFALAFLGYTEKNDCKEYKFGTFSIFFDGSQKSYFTIKRDKTTQIEVNPNGKKVFYTIEWLNECKYIQKFDNKKNKLTEEMKMINEDGGIVIEFLNKEDDKCINYQSYVKKFKKMSLRKGKFCTK